MGIRSAVRLACSSALVVGALLAPSQVAFADEPTAAPAANVASVAAVAPSAAVPQNVAWAKSATSAARLSWTAAAEADGSAPHYRIDVTFDSGEPYSIPDTTETSASIKIAPGVSAKATVTDIAQNASATSEQYTQPAVVPDAPEKVNVTARDMNYDSKPPALRAVWTAPEGDGGAEIKQYRVQLFAGKAKNRQLVDSSTVNSDTFSHTFSNLEFETFYAVEVSAINSAGKSKVAKSNQVETVAEPQASPKPTVTVSTPTPTITAPSTPTPTPTITTPVAPVTPSPTPSTQADASQLIYVAILPIIVLLLIAAIIALVYVVRYNRRVDAENRARELRNANKDF